MQNLKEFIHNDRFEVLTPEGFKDFHGLMIGTNKTIKITFSNSFLICTENHKLVINEEYEFKQAKDLNIGDKVLSINGYIEVLDIKDYKDSSKVYEFLEIEDNHLYFVNNILSHQCVFMDEFAFIPDNIAEEFMASVYPTIASSETSQMIIVSTPNGLNTFHHLWKQSVRGENGFKPIKVRWNEIPAYTEKFRELTIRDIGKRKWDAEFDCQFLGSSKTLIDATYLEKARTLTPIEYRYDDKLSIYEYPIPGTQYVFGIDSGKGIGSDYSVIQILKIERNEKISQVAMFRFNEISYDKFAPMIVGLAEFYNNAMLMIENNEAGMGDQVAKCIWNEYNYGNIVNLDKHNFGIRSNVKTKLAANMNLRKYLENGWLELVDVTTIYELSRYEEVKPDIFKAAGSGNDDTVTALIWGLYFVLTDYYDGRDVSIKKIDEQYKIKEGEEHRGPVALLGNNDLQRVEDFMTPEDFVKNYNFGAGNNVF